MIITKTPFHYVAASEAALARARERLAHLRANAASPTRIAEAEEDVLDAEEALASDTARLDAFVADCRRRGLDADGSDPEEPDY